MDTCLSARVFRTGWGHFELDLWHISYIIDGRNPKFSVWIHLGVVECHTLCLIYENLLSLGVFYQFVTQFMILHNNQLSNSAIQRCLFIGVTTLFSQRRKD